MFIIQFSRFKYCKMNLICNYITNGFSEGSTHTRYTHNLCHTKALSQHLGMELLYLTQNDFQQRYHAAKQGYYIKLKLNNNK